MGFSFVGLARLNVQLAFRINANMMCISNVVYQKHLILRNICMLFILLYDWYEPLLQKASHL